MATHGTIDMQVKLDPASLSALYRTAREADGTMQVGLRRGIKAAAEPVKQGVIAEASWSSRIPGAVKIKASFAKRGATVVVYVDEKRAPEAAPINNHDKGGTFRHPVYGHRDYKWPDQAARPFLIAGARRGQAAADAAMSAEGDRTARALGFR